MGVFPSLNASVLQQDEPSCSGSKLKLKYMSVGVQVKKKRETSQKTTTITFGHHFLL